MKWLEASGRQLVRTALVGSLILTSVCLSQQPESRFFPTTGFRARGQFLRFFDERGGIDVFGPPVSGEVVEDGVRVQYFRNFRLEWHPENPERYCVQPGLLGDLLGEVQPPIPSTGIPPAGLSDERYYPQTGHTLKYGFLEFFDRNGGLDLLGYPTTEMMFEPGGCVTQWFQRAQLEWVPDDSGGQIRFASLGESLRGAQRPRVHTQ